MSPPHSVNHKFPSGPAVMLSTLLLAVGTGYSVMVPLGVILPILFPPASVNHRLPSGPAVMPVGSLEAVGTGYSVTVPVVPEAVASPGVLRIIVSEAVATVAIRAGSRYPRRRRARIELF